MDWSLYGILPGTTGNVDPSSATPVAGQAGTASGTGSGRFGIIPHTGGTGMGGFRNDFVQWLLTPFTQPISGMTAFWFVFWLFVASFIWGLIMYNVRIAAEAI